jgi:Ni,Fe-hydrogenase III small subunit
MEAYAGLGYQSLVKKYGIRLIDFNAGKFVNIKVQEELTFHIAKEAVESDFLINFPVLKTHAQSKVSLGLKNLKGCLKTSSKKLCHHTNLGLEYCFSFVADCVKPALTIVDGIYALERGALHFGNAFRKDIIIASRDTLAADMVAAKTMGFDSQDITHFVEYGKRHNTSLNLQDYEIRGEELENHIKPLKWDWGWTKENTGPAIFEKFGVTGTAVPKYDETLCSGCSPFANMVNILVLSALEGKPLPRIEILNGKRMQARPGYDTTVLIGNCIIKANRENVNIRKAIEVKGCPPDPTDVISALREAALHVSESAYWGYMKQQGEKYDNQDGYSWDFYQ